MSSAIASVRLLSSSHSDVRTLADLAQVSRHASRIETHRLPPSQRFFYEPHEIDAAKEAVRVKRVGCDPRGHACSFRLNVCIQAVEPLGTDVSRCNVCESQVVIPVLLVVVGDPPVAQPQDNRYLVIS